jgi:DNA invertase Pin-like site-specific DNA recombinase
VPWYNHRGYFHEPGASRQSYYRVSTDKQGAQGYGIGAQREAVKQRLDGGGWQLLKEFTEVESGRRRSRLELAKALAYCKAHRTKLVVARLDRLTRNTRFLLDLVDSGVEPLFCDLPMVPGAMGKMILTVMAAVAELESGLVSERTKASLKVARERGKVFGGRNAQSDANAADAIAFAETPRPVIDEIVAAHGRNVSTHVIASELTRRRARTRTGGKQWSAMQALRLLRRLGERTMGAQP